MKHVHFLTLPLNLVSYNRINGGITVTRVNEFSEI